MTHLPNRASRPRLNRLVLALGLLHGAAAVAADSVPVAAAAEAAATPAVLAVDPAEALSLLPTAPKSRAELEAMLKKEYLACEQDAMRRVLDAGSAMRCSVLYEAVLRTVFRGRWEALRTWSAGALPAP